MRKVLIWFLAVIMLLSLCACGAEQAKPETTGSIAESNPNLQTEATEMEQETTEEQKPEIPALKLQKTASFTGNDLTAYYDNVIKFEAFGTTGIMDNNGTVRFEISNVRLTVLNEKYVVYHNGESELSGANEKGVLTMDGQTVISGDYARIKYVGADCLLITELVPCEKNDPMKMETGTGPLSGKCWKNKYSIYSLKENKFVNLVDFSACAFINDCDISEDHIMIYYQTADEALVTKVYYFEKDQAIELHTPHDWLQGGRAVYEGDILDPKGDVILDFEAFGCRLLEVATKTDDYYLVAKDDHRALMDKSGKILVEGDIGTGSKFVQGYIVVKKDGKFGMIDAEGNECIPFVYKEIQAYCGSVFAVETKEGWGFADVATGKVLMEPSIKAELDDGCFEKEKGYFLVNPFNGEITEYRYLKLLDKDMPGVYSAYNGKRRGVTTPLAEELMEFHYDEDGGSINISEDRKVITASKGMHHDIYIWE